MSKDEDAQPVKSPFDDPGSAASRDLIAQGNAAVDSAFDGAELDALRTRLQNLFERDDKLFVARKRADHIYDFHCDATHPKGIWRRLPSDQAPAADAHWETVFDVDAYCAQTGKDWVWSGPIDGPDPTRVLLELSDGGSDKSLTREFDLQTKTFVEDGFETPICRQMLAWEDHDTLLVCASTCENHMTRAGWPGTVRRLRRGQRLDEAEVLLRAAPEDLAVEVESMGAPGARTCVLRLLHTIRSNRLTILDPGRKRPTKAPLISTVVVGSSAVAWRPSESGDHPIGALVLELHGGSPRVIWTPTSRGAVTRFFLSDRWLIALGHESLKPWLKVLDLKDGNAALKDITLPSNATTVDAWFSAIDPDVSGDAKIDVIVESPIQTSEIMRFDPADPDRALIPISALPQTFIADGMVSSLHEARSADGTLVPYHLALPPDAKQGPVPIVLRVYGGFGISMEAGYQFVGGPSLLEVGIGIALCHIRGGGEFGPAWHEAAMRKNRFRSFDDIRAIADDLIARGLGAKGRLGLSGGSHGGLLACAMLTQAPDLFAAVKADVPVTDMLNFHRHSVGAGWLEEYGNPDNAYEAATLQSYSPLHSVRSVSDVRYPPVLIDAPANDDRVDPSHARKFGARLRDAGQDFFLRTPDSGGHRGGGSTAARAQDLAVEGMFFRKFLTS